MRAVRVQYEHPIKQGLFIANWD